MTLAAIPDSTPRLLDEAEARALTNRIRQCVAVALVDIEKAFRGRAWEAMGYSTWDEYCSSEFGDHIRLPRDERQAAVAQLRQAGMSTRAIASATGAAQTTVVRDLATEPNESVDRVTSLDGRSRPAVQIRPVESDETRLEREDREAQYHRDDARRRLNEKVGDVLFVLAEMASLPDTLTDFANGYRPPAPPITAEDLRRVALAIEQLRDHWNAS